MDEELAAGIMLAVFMVILASIAIACAGGAVLLWLEVV